MRCLEPGYYHDGEFGIRIESLVVVKDAKTQVNIFNRYKRILV